MGLVPVAMLLLLGCSESERATSIPPSPSARTSKSIGIVLQGNGPRLQIAITFMGVTAPESHVESVAAALVKVRASCFSAGATRASVRAKVSNKTFHVIPSSVRDCFARTLDGAPIEDPADFEVYIEVSP